MINVLDEVKNLYKSDSTPKKYFIMFRDPVVEKDDNHDEKWEFLTNKDITSESLQITESVCSSGNFKVGLCECATSKVSVVLDENVKGNEITIFQVLGNFEPIIDIDDNKGFQISGPGVTELETTFTSTNIISGLDNTNFSKDKDYLIFAKLKYIGDPIYLYVETPGGVSRMVYYLKPGLFNFINLESWSQNTQYEENYIVIHNGYIWESRTYNNSAEPGSLVNGQPTNAWRNITHYVQVVIPIIGSEFYENKLGVYVNTSSEYGTLVGDATIYELDYKVMPLGVYTVNGCKRSNDGRIRELECYDRMQDVGLDVDVYITSTNYATTGSASSHLGEILNDAASSTQIVIGSNLSKQAITPIFVSEETLSFPEFPTNTDLYKTETEETQIQEGTYTESLDTYTRWEQIKITGTYSENSSAEGYERAGTRTEQTYRDGVLTDTNSTDSNVYYQHTQMQIIDGVLDETANSNNKEYSTTLWSTFKGTVIEFDDSGYDSSSPKYRSKGTRRKTSSPYSDSRTETWKQDRELRGGELEQDEYWSYNWIRVDIRQGNDDAQGRPTYYDLNASSSDNSGSGRSEYDPRNDWDIKPSNYLNGNYIGEYFWIYNVNHHDPVYSGTYWEESDWYLASSGAWTYNSSSKKMIGGKEYVYYSESTESQGEYSTESSWSNNSRTKTRKISRTVVFKRDTDYGYVYPYNISNSEWILDTTYRNTEYYTTGISNKSGWVDKNGNAIKANSFLDVKKTLYWKYTWASLLAKTTGCSAWSWYDTQAYQSSTSGSGAKYYLKTSRPDKDNYYTKPNTIYSNSSVYQKMSKRYTRTHKYYYKFTAPSGWTWYHPSGSVYDAKGNFIRVSSDSNKTYKGVTFDAKNTFTNQKKVGVYSNATVYTSLSRHYTRIVNYGYVYVIPSKFGSGWSPKDSEGNFYVPDANVTSDIKYKDNQELYTDTAGSKVTQQRTGTIYNTRVRTYRRSISYGYDFTAPAGKGWTHSEPDYNNALDPKKYVANRTTNEITSLDDVYNVKYRKYERESTYTWQESAVLKKIIYAIPQYDDSMSYSVFITYPTDTKASVEENTVKELAQNKASEYEESGYTYSGEFITNKQNLVEAAILARCTKTSEVTPGYYTLNGATVYGGTFEVVWISELVYNGYVKHGNNAKELVNSLSGIIRSENPYKVCEAHSQAEKFNDMPVMWMKETIHGKRRDIISGFLELHGMFINFDRYGVSTTRNVKSSTLYPAENLYPHDSTIPGNEPYGDIYPSLGSDEITPVSVCKSIYIDDDLNNEFNGVLISKSSIAPEEAGIFPFYYNRLSKRYGTLPASMPEIGYWEGNNYYKIENNFFIDNFIFGDGNTLEETQADIIFNLKKICQQILDIIGNLQYFNLTAELRCLPYMEVGDSINIMTPKNGYETAILRRIMKGCVAQMDNIETDFYD